MIELLAPARPTSSGRMRGETGWKGKTVRPEADGTNDPRQGP